MKKSDFSHSQSYETAGIDSSSSLKALEQLLKWTKETYSYRQGIGAPVLPNGFFANAVWLSDDLLLVISTDGVGSKTVVAQLANSYEGIGFDCIAVNVNDVLCTGAEPLALVDYISCETPQSEMLEQLGKGLAEGAKKAGIAIVGGELSQHPDTLSGPRPGYAFDIAGTAIGILKNRQPITGSNIHPGDVILGFPSNGIHSNGLTLARHILLGKPSHIDRYLPECASTVGEELLRPTAIYVSEVLALLSMGINIKGLAHISGNGLLNLTRLNANVSFSIDALPSIPPIFKVIQDEGKVTYAEMFKVFNMGIGFCIVVGPGEVDRTVGALKEMHLIPHAIGSVTGDPGRRVYLPQFNLVGANGSFSQQGIN